MIVVLAEKPSVARDLAAFLGARNRHEGYLEGNGYQVTWALGHLVTLKEPDEYDPALKRWSLEPLPFVPEEFELKVIPEKRAREQFAIVKRLFKAADELICATDAGREGELIFRYVLELSGCRNKPVRRLWLSSLTDAAIRDAWKHLRSAKDYDNLYAAARCRAEADWIVGMNATRNYTVRHRESGSLWSAGRVQTPVLAMIVHRDDDIRCFHPRPFWELLTKYREVMFRYDPAPPGPKAASDGGRTEEPRGRFFQQADAQAMFERVVGREFEILKQEQKEERIPPPLLYDLTELQRDMNRRYGLSAAQTLSVAQKLYEAKHITYPRTDSRYLGSDQKSVVPDILRALSAIKPNEIAPLDLARLPFSSRIINDAKVGDHHAIIPTESVPKSLGGRDQQVYDAIVTRFIAAFYPPCRKEVTNVYGQANQVPFRTKGVRILAPGWTALSPRKSRTDDGEEDEPLLPAFTPGERGPHEPLLKQGETKPPPHYTEATLLGAMETAGQTVDDDELKEAMKERGLGTPATRAAIIETLLTRGYIVREKKSLLATDAGRYLIALIRAPSLKSAELTGQWEAKLKQIEAGRLDARLFMDEIVRYTRVIVRSSDVSTIDDQTLGECPRCGRPVIAGKQGYGCSGWRDGCAFVLWKSYREREFTVAEIRELLQRRVLLTPITFTAGEPVILALHESGSLVEIPVPVRRERGARPSGRGEKAVSRERKPRRRRESSSEPKASRKSSRKRDAGASSARRVKSSGEALGRCPSCGADVTEQPKSFGCSAWRDGCKFAIWKTIAGKKITPTLAKKLLEAGETDELDGFRSKAGKPFSASLKIEDGAVRLVFA